MVVNQPKSVAYRAPGVPAIAFAMETAIDELCDKLGMEPLEFRLFNSAKEGVRTLTGWERQNADNAAACGVCQCCGSRHRCADQ